MMPSMGRTWTIACASGAWIPSLSAALLANICVHYTAASAALRWFKVIIPKDATSALDPFDLETSLRQTAFLFNGKITQSEAIAATA